MSDKATPRPWVIWEGPSYVGGGADLCIGAGENWLFNMDHRHCEARPHHWGLCGCKPEGDIQIASGPEGKVCPGGDCKHEDCITAEQRANAELIVSAVNAYEAHQRAAQALIAIGGGVGTQIAFLKKCGAPGPECLRSGGRWDDSDSYFSDDYETQARWNAEDQDRLRLAVIRAALAELDKVTTR